LPFPNREWVRGGSALKHAKSIRSRSFGLAKANPHSVPNASPLGYVIEE
jgi:hypothetical protein